MGDVQFRYCPQIGDKLHQTMGILYGDMQSSH